jgi:hypothetical protein
MKNNDFYFLKFKTLEFIMNRNKIALNQDLDVANLPTGMYLVQLWNGTKKVQTSKLSVVK